MKPLEWIDVKQNRPLKDSVILVTNIRTSNQIYLATYIDGQDVFYVRTEHPSYQRIYPLDITHWMDLPEPPRCLHKKRIRTDSMKSHPYTCANCTYVFKEGLDDQTEG